MSSPAGIPTDRRLKDPTYLKDKIENLFEQEHKYSQVIEYYEKKILLNDWWAPWYTNAKASYDKKLDTVRRELKSIGGKDAEVKPKEEVIAVASAPTPSPVKEKQGK